jgi:site-specific DNA recombinase
MLDTAYEEQLKRIHLAPEVYELFELVLQDENILSTQEEHIEERKNLLDEMTKQQSLISKARKLLLTEKIDFVDFSELKREYKQALEGLNDQLVHVNKKLSAPSRSDNNWSPNEESGIFQSYKIVIPQVKDIL